MIESRVNFSGIIARQGLERLRVVMHE